MGDYVLQLLLRLKLHRYLQWIHTIHRAQVADSTIRTIIFGPVNRRRNQGFCTRTRLGSKRVNSPYHLPAACRSFGRERGLMNAFVTTLDGKTAEASLLGLDSLAPIKAVIVQ